MTVLAASPPAYQAVPKRRPFVRKLAVAALLVLCPAFASCSGPRFVERVTFVNSTLYDLDVDVTDAKRDVWLDVGHVGRETETTTEQVLDQGETWIFRFRHEGRDAGELQVSRQDLQRNGWRVAIPQSVAERLRELGAEPSLGSGLD